MKNIMFVLGVLACGVVSGYTFGYAVGIRVYDNRQDVVPEDIAKACRIVTHSNSDGFSYWSCEKNR